MKKRIFCLCLALILLFVACKSEPSSQKKPSFTMYFINDAISTDGSVFCTIQESLDASQLTVQEAIDLYRRTSVPTGASSAIHPSWSLEGATMEENTVYLSFRGRKLSDLQTYLSAASLTKTLSQLSGVEEVCLQLPGQAEPICLSASNVLLEDTAMLPQKESIVLYLPDASGRYLTKYTQTVEAMETVEKPKYVLQRLIELSAIPKGTELTEISVENGLCKVELSSAFVENMQRSFAKERLAIYSIVNSLTELSEITTVDIWIEDTPLDQLYFMDLPAGLERNEDLLYVDDDAVQDVDLYLSFDGERLTAVPYRLQLSDNINLNDQILNALISFEEDYGAVNYIPNGTKLLNLRMEGSACIVDLSGEFLANCTSEQEERLAVYTIVATMCAVEGISSVEILVEGLEPVYCDAALKNVRQPEDSWYAEKMPDAS